MPKKKNNNVKAEIKKITKKKKRKVYFGQEVQDAIIEYNLSEILFELDQNESINSKYNKIIKDSKINEFKKSSF